MALDKRRKEVGQMGESIASEFLERKGFRVIARNYRKPWGEIDIIAKKGDTFRFVELVDVRKLRKLARTATLYMEAASDRREYQIDVVGVILDMATRKARCRLFEQALEGEL